MGGRRSGTRYTFEAGRPVDRTHSGASSATTRFAMRGILSRRRAHGLAFASRRAILRYVRASPDNGDRLCGELQAAWRNAIPLAAAIGVEASAFDGERLRVRAPIGPNLNVHGTAFAGSLYSVCVLTAWGAVWLALRGRALNARIVVTESRIDYDKAVTADILCQCRFAASARDVALNELVATNRAAITLRSTIEAGNATAVTFEGRYALKLRRSSRSAGPPG
jgi:thioesterase domain-containing protein